MEESGLISLEHYTKRLCRSDPSVICIIYEPHLHNWPHSSAYRAFNRLVYCVDTAISLRCGRQAADIFLEVVRAQLPEQYVLMCSPDKSLGCSPHKTPLALFLSMIMFYIWVRWCQRSRIREYPTRNVTIRSASYNMDMPAWNSQMIRCLIDTWDFREYEWFSMKWDDSGRNEWVKSDRDFFTKIKYIFDLCSYLPLIHHSFPQCREGISEWDEHENKKRQITAKLGKKNSIQYPTPKDEVAQGREAQIINYTCS